MQNEKLKTIKRFSGAGFTLVELLLYVGLAATLLLSISVFLSISLQSQAKNQTIAEVEQEGQRALQLITQTIRNASSTNYPAQGNSSSSLSLIMPTPSKNPTVFNLVSSTIFTTEGVSSPISLTSSRLIASNLQFDNFSRINTRGIIRVSFTLTYNNFTGRNEFDYSKTFYGTATLRNK